MKSVLKTAVSRYTIVGVLIGVPFPVIATLIECQLHYGPLTVSNIILSQAANPVLWIIDTAPLFFGLLFYLVGIKQAKVELYASSLKDMVADQTADLDETKNYLESIINAMADLMLILDNNGIIRKINAAVLSVTGFEESELVGQSAAVILGQADLEKILLNSTHDVFEGGFLRNIEGDYPTQSGYPVSLSLSVSYMWNESGEQTGIICVGKNITEQRKMETALRRSEEQFKGLVQSLNVIIMKADAQLNFTFLNTFGQAFFGYSEGELLGKNIIGTIAPAEDSTGRDLKRVIDQIVKQPDTYAVNENENIRKNGERVWVAWRNQPVFDEQGNLLEIMSTGYDVTERRKAEKIINNQNLKLEAVHLQMNNEMEQARKAQLKLLPKKLPEIPQVKLAVKYSPMAQIGGDFYDVFIDGQEKLGILVGDVTGHGIPAALLSFLFLTTFKNNRIDAALPNVSMQLSNSELVGNLPNGKYATMYFCTYDLEHRMLSYSSAGHPPGLLIRPGAEQLISLETSGMVVGMFENPVLPFESKSIELFPGDKVLIYTDGILEVTNDHQQMAEMGDLETFLISNNHQPVNQLLDSIYDFCSEYSGQHGFDDDVTMIGMEIL